MPMLAALLVLAHPVDVLGHLVGHCWRGTIAADTTDTHCFMQEGRGGVRDRHVVRHAGAIVYRGETEFHRRSQGAWNFSYSNTGGRVASGIAQIGRSTIDFGTTRTPRGNARVTWRFIDARRYDIISAPEAQASTRVRLLRID
jgi:hypothetical protein